MTTRASLTCSRPAAAAFVILLLVGAPAEATSAAEAAEDYAGMREGRYGVAVAVTGEGVTLRHGDATWRLERGSVRLLEPTTAGVVSGLVFTGEGRFTMTVPDAGELEQLRRVAEDPELAGVDEAFTRLVLRTSLPLVADAFPGAISGAIPGAGAAGGQPDALARERHKVWLHHQGHDADARVVAALRLPGDVYLRADVDTAGLGWLTYQHDGLDDEEVLLARHRPREGFVEEWVRLDRPADRRPDGSPRGPNPRLVDLRHLDVAVDLRRIARRMSPLGIGDVQPRLAAFRAELTFVPTATADGATALPLELDPLVRVTAVRDEDGAGLPFLRHHAGKTVSHVDFASDAHDDDLVLLLDRPLAAGVPRRLVVESEREVLNFVPGDGWYPTEADGRLDPHTARLALTAGRKDTVRAMGRLVEEREEGDARVSVWEVERPVRAVTFSFAEKFHEATVTVDGGREVVAFADYSGFTLRDRARGVAGDVAGAVAFFRRLFAAPLPAERLYATAILGAHGQSFDGFLHLAEHTFVLESRGPSELFHAHEAAHQWWGDLVAWAGYRDQWLSEAFAEYSAMLYVEAETEKGSEHYDEIVRAYSGLAVGRLDRMSRFVRWSALEPNEKHRRRIGPISLGYRAATATTPGGYRLQTYVKGALVLHMLRTMLRDETGSDDRFVAVLRDFVATHRGGAAASTADFVAALTRVVPGDWGWFFDQWVHGTAIPTYAWRSTVAVEDGRQVLRLDVEQRDVPAGFRMPVPVRLDYGQGDTAQVVVLVDEPRETFTIPLERRPKDVVFNPDLAVLARLEKL